MRYERQHEVVRDASLTFAHILKTYIPPHLDKKQAVEVAFEVPDVKKIDKMKTEGKILLSLILIDTAKSTVQQSTEEPIVREEDPETGDIYEYRLGAPTFIQPRYLVTPWSGDSLFDQIVQGLVMKIFFAKTMFLPEDIQGKSISPDANPQIIFDERFGLEKQMKLWQVMGYPFKASIVYSVNLRIDSLNKVPVRRVKERILDYRKIEG